MMDIITLIMACSIFQDYSITNAMIQIGSKNNNLMVTPADGNPTIFPTENQAVSFIKDQLQQDNAVDIGATQLPSRWLKTYQVTPTDVIRPCKNVVIATQIITQMWEQCGHLVSDPSSASQVQACALSMFKTGDPKAGLNYANQVMQYAASHPFQKLAAPAMARWEKNAKVPKLPTVTLSKSNSKPPVAIKTNPPAQDNSVTMSNTDTVPVLPANN